MDIRASHETTRIQLQAGLDAAKDKAERNRLGQFATPPELARELVAYALNLLPAGEKIKFLDPAIGTGSFYSALLEEAGSTPIAAAAGFEIDPHYGDPARALWSDTPLRLELADFTRQKPPKASNRFNLILTNPPYVRHHHLSSPDKERLQAAAFQAIHLKLSGLSGLYCYFLALSHLWMEEGGIACWLIPSEFMDVNYGRELKRYLLEQVTLLRIHRFDPADVQFEDALVSSAVVWFRNTPPPLDHQVSFTYGGSHTIPKLSRSVDGSTLKREHKWTRFPEQAARAHEPMRPRLADLFEIKRGLATGDNSFFILSQEQIDREGLPLDQFTPILPSPRYLDQDIVPSDSEGLPRLKKPLFLLDCRLPPEVVRERYPRLWDYLSRGETTVATRYLCSKRALWYMQENRPPAPIICTYMGRSDTRSGRPFRFILNRSRAVVANTYLNLYPRPTVSQALARHPELIEPLWAALNRLAPSAMLAEGRVYGGGLHKLEPKELAQVPADELLSILGPYEQPQLLAN